MSESAAKKKEVVRTVSGMVLDQEENPIAGAVVEMTDLQNGKKLAIYTSDDGHYLFSTRVMTTTFRPAIKGFLPRSVRPVLSTQATGSF